MSMDSASREPSHIGDFDRRLARAAFFGDSEALAAILSLGHCSAEGCERAFINATQQGHARCVEQRAMPAALSSLFHFAIRELTTPLPCGLP